MRRGRIKGEHWRAVGTLPSMESVVGLRLEKDQESSPLVGHFGSSRGGRMTSCRCGVFEGSGGRLRQENGSRAGQKNRQKIRNVIGQNDKYGVETDDESKILIVRRQNHENKHILGKNVHFVIK
jgi:hypothetical protein